MIMGLKHTNDLSIEKVTEHSTFILAFFLEMLGYLSFVFFITHLVKKAAFVAGIYFIYTFIAEPVLAFKIDTIAPFLPLQAFGNLIHMPFAKYLGQSIPESVDLNDVTISLFYIVLFSFMSWLLIEKRDL